MQHMHIIIMASNSQVAILHTQCIIVPTELYSHLLDDNMPCWSCCHPIIHFTHIQVTMLGWQWLWFFAAVLHCVRSLASLQLLCAWHGMSSLFKMWALMRYSSLWIVRTSGATQISMWELGPKCCMACHGHIIPDFSVESTEIWYIINYRLIVPIFIPVNLLKFTSIQWNLSKNLQQSFMMRGLIITLCVAIFLMFRLSIMKNQPVFSM